MLFDPKWSPPAKEIKLEPWQEILLKAADIIEERGWTQGAFTKPGGSVCILGALNRASGRTADGDKPLKGATQFMVEDRAAAEQRLISIFSYNVPAWNDDDGRTKKQVLKALRNAAKVNDAV